MHQLVHYILECVVRIAILDLQYDYLLNSKVLKEHVIKAYSHRWKTKIIKKQQWIVNIHLFTLKHI